MAQRFKIVSLAMVALLSAGIINSVAAFSDGYIVTGSYGASKTYLLDTAGMPVHVWDHSELEDPGNGYACYLLTNGNLLRSGQAPQTVTVSSSAAPRQGTLSEIDAKGNLIWTYMLANDSQMTHHDFKPMPNGNVLCVSFLTKTKEDAIALGFDPELFGGGGGFPKTKWGGMGGSSVEVERIFELQPDRTGAGNHQIVWEWNTLDHFVPITEDAAAHPEKLSGYVGPFFFNQWMHLNGLDYNPTKDLIVFSSRVFSEIFIIDHSTTTAEAATSAGGNYGKGGDILYRWGRPSNYLVKFEYDTVITPEQVIPADTSISHRTGDTTITPERVIPPDTSITRTQVLDTNDYIHVLHCPTWIPEGYPGAGNIMFFHNNVDDGMSELGSSQAVEVTPAVDGAGAFEMTPGAANGPAGPVWVYDPGETGEPMFSASMSSAIKMKNGNTIIHEAYPGGNQSGNSSTIREVNSEGELVWGPLELDPSMWVDSSDTTEEEEEEVSPWGGGGGGGFIAGFNPAKIMYYPSDYVGITALMDQINGTVMEPKKMNGAVKNCLPRIMPGAGVIRFSNVAGTEISVYSLLGRRVAFLNPAGNTAEISKTSLSSGSYLIRVRAEGQVKASRTVSIF